MTVFSINIYVFNQLLLTLQLFLFFPLFYLFFYHKFRILQLYSCKFCKIIFIYNHKNTNCNNIKINSESIRIHKKQCGKHLSNVVALYKMSQSVLRLFVNNAINFMILFPLPFSPPSRNLNKQSCKKK